MANAIVFQISWGFFAKIIFWSRIQGKQILECFHSNCCQGGKPSTHLKELFEFYDLVKLHCFLMISTWVILSQTCFIVPVAIATVPKLVNISYIWSYVQAAKTLRFVEKQVLKVICYRLTENAIFPAKLFFFYFPSITTLSSFIPASNNTLLNKRLCFKEEMILIKFSKKFAKSIGKLQQWNFIFSKVAGQWLHHS